MKKILLSIAICFNILAQAQIKDNSMINEWSLSGKKISFQKPDSNFVILTDRIGYMSSTIDATITGSLFPGSYVDAEAELKKIKNTKKIRLLDTLHHLYAGKQAFTLVQEETAPQEYGNETFVLITTIIAGSDYTTFMIVGSYPKSQDKNLRNKFIRSSLSIKIVDIQ